MSTNRILADIYINGGVKVVGAELLPHNTHTTIHTIILSDELVGITFTRPPHMRALEERSRDKCGKLTRV